VTPASRPIAAIRLGISSWSLPWSVGVPGRPSPQRRLDAAALIDRGARAAVDIVQIADNLPLAGLSAAELDRLAGAAAERGIELELGTRSLDVAHIQSEIAIAQRLGARRLRTVLSGARAGPAQVAAAGEAVRLLVPSLEAAGVVLALENNEVLAASEYDAIIRETASPNVRICLDTANSVGRPELLDTVLDRLAPHTVMLHAKDYDVRRIDTRMGFEVVGAAAGEGRVDFDAALRRLAAEAPAPLSVIVEHWPPFLGSIEATVAAEEHWLERSLTFLRGSIARCADAPAACERQ
jgi:sugar phosphate isomerase/epimerase